MSTAESQTAGIDPQDLADLEAVMRHVNEGTPVEPELARRVRERSDQITEATRRRYGNVDVDSLLHSVRDGE